MEFSWVPVLVVLGCHLDGSDSTETQVQGRLEQGRKMFGKMRPLLCCSRIPEEERIKTFYTTVDHVDKSSAAPFIPGKQVASLHAGWSEIPRRFVGGLVSYNETLCACVEMQTESSVLVAQRVGGCVWLGWTRCSEKHLPSWTCCNPVA